MSASLQNCVEQWFEGVKVKQFEINMGIFL